MRFELPRITVRKFLVAELLVLACMVVSVVADAEWLFEGAADVVLVAAGAAWLFLVWSLLRGEV